ncbi:MAG: 3-deoxy-D-manno-octulosonic acid transferase [Planctomycetaceae bacterium]|nr:3-deoxy-D-manno-octulosonic acid transferase [Planctomycetaceae bacterium]
MGLILNLVYLLALLLAGPWIFLSRLRRRKSLGNLRQKLFGELPISTDKRQAIWLHAVSVGEVLQLQSIVKRLTEQHPDYRLVITTTTTTGYGVAAEKYGSQHEVCYFPFDFTWSVRRALRRIRPALVVLVELELWPNFIRETHRAGIPTCLINGRVTERSWKRYHLIRPLIGSLLKKLSSIQVQDGIYAERLINLGAPVERVEVTGSIKFDGIRCDRDAASVKEIRAGFGIDSEDLVLIAGSTQAPEEELALDCYEQLKKDYPRLRLMLVPRHAERFEEVAELVVSRSIPLVRRTEVRGKSSESSVLSRNAVLLLDTLGELSAAWGVADLAFVGGSFGERGGQNMIEPAGYGACVMFGPNTWNFRDAVQLLLENGGAVLIPTPEAFTPTVRKSLSDLDLAREIGSWAKRVVLSQQGAADRTVARIAQFLKMGDFPSKWAA